MAMFGNYRDCQAWMDVGMPLNTTSNEACKMYHATVVQMCTRQSDSSIGGMDVSMQKMLEADSDFIMGNVVKEYMDSQRPIKKALKESQWEKLSNMEKGHVRALEYLSQGHDEKAVREWEDILREYPKDFIAINMVYQYTLAMGQFEKERDTVAMVLPFFQRKRDVEYGYLTGLYAFALEETNLYDQAEAKAKEALDCDRHDAWASHSLAHVYEMTGRYNDGIEFLTSTQNDWEAIKGLECHIHWHNVLFKLEQGDIEGALSYYDNEVRRRLQSTGGMFELSDAVGVLFRLKMRGIDVGQERWQELGDHLNKHSSSHVWQFYDACVMLGLCGMGNHKRAEEFLQELRELSEKNETHIQKVAKSVTVDLCEAIQHHEAGRYEEAVELLVPIRYKIIQIGGSHAQRDVFSSLLLISAASKSPKIEHQKLARQLLYARKTMKDTPVTQSLLSQLVFSHEAAQQA